MRVQGRSAPEIRASRARLAVGVAFAALLSAYAWRSLPKSAPPALVIGAGALVLAALGLRALRLRLLARAAGADASDGALTGIGLAAGAADFAFFRGVGGALSGILVARRGAGSTRAGGILLALYVIDLFAFGLLAVLGIYLLLGGVPEYARFPLVATCVGAAVVGAIAIAFASPVARRLDARFPAAWREADLTPGGVARSAFATVRRAGALPILALSFAAVAVEAGAFALAAASAGYGPLDGWAAGLPSLGAFVSPAERVASADFHHHFTMLMTTAGADWNALFDANTALLRTRVAVSAIAGVAPALAWAASRAPTALPGPDASLARSEGFRVAAVLAIGLWIRRVQWSTGLPFARRDVHVHHQYVEAVLSGNFLPLAPEFQMAYHPPLYYWLNAPLWAAFGGWGYLAFNTLAVFALFLVLYALLARLGVPERLRLGALGVAVVLPGLTGASVSVTNDVLVGFFSAVMIWKGLPFLDGTATRRDGWILGAATGGAMLTKFNAFLPAAVLAVAALVAARGRLRAPHWIAFGTASVLALPWYARNMILYGAPAANNSSFATEEVSRLPLPDGLFVHATQFDGESRAIDAWGLLVQTTFWPFDAPFVLHAPATASVGFPLLVPQAFLVAGTVLALLALAGAVAAIVKGTLVERTLAAIALGMLAAQMSYYVSFPITASLSGPYLLPALPAYAYLSCRALRDLASVVPALRRAARARSRATP